MSRVCDIQAQRTSSERRHGAQASSFIELLKALVSSFVDGGQHRTYLWNVIATTQATDGRKDERREKGQVIRTTSNCN